MVEKNPLMVCMAGRTSLMAANVLAEKGIVTDSLIGGLRLTTAKYYLPSGETIEEIGVLPDIKVEQQKDNFKINDSINDNQLIYALKLLKVS